MKFKVWKITPPNDMTQSDLSKSNYRRLFVSKLFHQDGYGRYTWDLNHYNECEDEHLNQCQHQCKVARPHKRGQENESQFFPQDTEYKYDACYHRQAKPRYRNWTELTLNEIEKADQVGQLDEEVSDY